MTAVSEHPRVRAALLKFLSNPEDGDLADFASFDELLWRECTSLAIRSRTAPLLAASLRQCPEVVLPEAVWQALLKAEKNQSLISLAQAHGLARTSSLLRQEGIEAVALKGAALAIAEYPAPHLRPLRDIDLLVAPDEVEAAHQFLLSQPDFERASWAGRYGREHSHQMPEIVDRGSGTVIELHHRINARNWAEDQALASAIMKSAVATDLLGEKVLLADPASNMLHLVEHATLHHVFANGPLILSDMHYLTAHHDFDWQAVEQRARALGLARPLALVGALAKRHGASWVPANLAAVPAEHVDSAEAALWREDKDHRCLAQAVRLSARNGGEQSAVSAMTRVFRPDRSELARLTRRSADDPFRWLGYPAWLLEKGARYLRMRSDRVLRDALPAHARLVGWLDRQEPDD